MTFSRTRWLLAVTLAAALAALPVVASHFLGGMTSRAFVISAFGFVTSWVMWCATTPVFVARSLRRGKSSPFAFYLSGSVLACLFPLAEVAVVAIIFPVIVPSMEPPAPFREVPIGAALIAGVYCIPFGMLAGWLFWRLAVRPFVAHVEDHHRRWQDLRMWRVMLALVLAAAVAGVLAYGTGILLVGLPPASLTIAALAPAMMLVEVWFLVLGLVYLFAISRHRGSVGRRECFRLGALLTCFFPVFAIAAGLILDVPLGIGENEDVGTSVSMIWVAIANGVLLIPLGLFSGWILWRVGVWPARPADIAPVFD
jgi:hypothetical protein